MLLRLTQHAESTPGKYRVEVSIEGDGPRRTATAPLEFGLSAQDQEDLRWYLEDYLQFPLDPAPRIAERLEKRMAEIGDALFKAVFHADDHARDLWAALRENSTGPRRELRVEVRPSAWTQTDLAPLEPLPKNKRPVTTWPDPDQAWLTIVTDLDPHLRRPP